jgi:hypothetical protein
MEAESQVVVTTLLDHDFQDAVKNGERRICAEADYVEGDGGQ